MAKDVDRAPKEIATAHGGMNPDEATAYVRCMAADRPCVRDVY